MAQQRDYDSEIRSADERMKDYSRLEQYERGFPGRLVTTPGEADESHRLMTDAAERGQVLRKIKKRATTKSSKKKR